MQDWIGLLIAFVLGFFMKHLLGTVCESRLVEGLEYTYNGVECEHDKCPYSDLGYECVGGKCLSPDCAPNPNPDGDGEWKRYLEGAKDRKDYYGIIEEAGPPLPAKDPWNTPWKLNKACGAGTYK